MPKKGSSTDTSLWHLRADVEGFIDDGDDYAVMMQAQHFGKTGDNPHVHALVQFKKPVSKYMAKKALQSILTVDYALSLPTTPQEFLDYVCWEFVELTDGEPAYSPLISEFLRNTTELYPDIEKSTGIYKAKHLIKKVDFTPADVYQACVDHISSLECRYSQPGSVVDLYLKKMMEFDVVPSQFTRESHFVKLWILAGFREHFAKFEKARVLKKYFES